MEFFTSQAVFVISLFLVSIFFVLSMMVWLSRKKEVLHGSFSPYTHQKMRLGSDIAKSMQEYVNLFITEEIKGSFQQQDNPPIHFNTAAICNETGRIFPNCVSPHGVISLDWSFLEKRCMGSYISWGVLSEHEKAVMKLLHESLDGFQVSESSMKIQPRNVESEYALLSPGPLYIDRTTKIVVGWKKVPGTYFEVLFVQRPMYESIDDTL